MWRHSETPTSDSLYPIFPLFQKPKRGLRGWCAVCMHVLCKQRAAFCKKHSVSREHGPNGSWFRLVLHKGSFMERSTFKASCGKLQFSAVFTSALESRWHTRCLPIAGGISSNSNYTNSPHSLTMVPATSFPWQRLGFVQPFIGLKGRRGAGWVLILPGQVTVWTDVGKSMLAWFSEEPDSHGIICQ